MFSKLFGRRTIASLIAVVVGVLLINAALLAGAIWLVVWVLRAVGVLS